MKAMERARESGDTRLVHRIERFVPPPLFGFPGGSPFPEPSRRGGAGAPPVGLPPGLPPELVQLVELFGIEVLEEMGAAAARGEEPGEFADRLFGDDIDVVSDPGSGARGGTGRGGRRGRGRGGR